MLRCVTDARAVEEEVVVAARDELERTAPMKLDHRICPTGEAVVDLGGDLDILSADLAVNYVTDVIDRHRGPVTVNLTALAFCDARGLAALVRMAGYADRKGWATPGILEALIPGRMQGHGGTEEVPG